MQSVKIGSSWTVVSAPCRNLLVALCHHMINSKAGIKKKKKKVTATQFNEENLKVN